LLERQGLVEVVVVGLEVDVEEVGEDLIMEAVEVAVAVGLEVGVEVVEDPAEDSRIISAGKGVGA
jgi:hypothetical protein